MKKGEAKAQTCDNAFHEQLMMLSWRLRTPRVGVKVNKYGVYAD